MKLQVLIGIAFVLLAGCVQIDSNKATPTPQVIYVNASPQVIVTVVPSAVPVVTEKIVYPSASKIPYEERKGGLTDLGLREEYVPFDISNAANADYHHNPYLILNTIGKNYFPDLQEGNLYWGKVPFHILGDYDTARKWSVLTTASEDFYSASFLTSRTRITEIYFLVSGSFRKGDRRILGEIKLNYGDGDIQTINVVSNENVWNYEPDAEFPIPLEKIAWQYNGTNGTQTLTLIGEKLTRPLTPISAVTIKRTATGENGFTLFAATGVQKFRTKRLLFTQTEFQEEGYNRVFSTTLTAGAMINYDDSGGVRVYRPEGVFESPVIDGETELVNWKRISWDADQYPGTTVKFQYRTGNTVQIDGRWTEWEDVQNNADIPKDGMFLQWRALMTTSDSARSPLLKELVLEYENPLTS